MAGNQPPGPQVQRQGGERGTAEHAHPEVRGSRRIDVDLALPVDALVPVGHVHHQVPEGPSLAQRQLQDSLARGSVGPVQPVSHGDHQPRTIQVQVSCKRQTGRRGCNQYEKAYGQVPRGPCSLITVHRR